MSREGFLVAMLFGAAILLTLGAMWPGTDRQGRFWRAVRVVGSTPTVGTPRDAIYGFIPGGLACLALLAGVVLGGRTAFLIGFFAACGLGYIGIWFTWRPPARLKPKWVIDAERRGARPVRMDLWDRGLCVAIALLITLIVVCVGLLLITSPKSQ